MNGEKIYNKKHKSGDNMNIYIILTAILLLLDISCAVSLIFIERRDSTTTWAWLLVLAIFPFLGFILSRSRDFLKCSFLLKSLPNLVHADT